jgi:hypothetical protein
MVTWLGAVSCGPAAARSYELDLLRHALLTVFVFSRSKINPVFKSLKLKI